MTIQPQQQRSTSSSKLFIFIICLIFRLLNAFLTRTYDNPDEYWQGQEVAHYLVFGRGYLTWEWREMMRSFPHPLTIASVYKLLQLLGLDDTMLLTAAPRYFQATLAAIADMATYALAKQILGNGIAFPMLFTMLCSWFNFHMAARTLSNSVEMVFTMLALNFWPLMKEQRIGWLARYRIALLFASIACIMRPTNVLIWLFLGLYLIITSHRKQITIILNAVVIGTLVLAANAWLDTRLYDSSKWVLTPWTFFQINVVHNISLFYGAHTWHWYLTQGLPVIFTTMLPMMLYGIYCMSSDVKQRMRPLLMMTVWIVAIYSLLPHKEFRFMFPIVPVLLMTVAYGLQQLQPRSRVRVMWALVLTQLPMALYLSLWHQRGVIDVMKWLKTQEGSIGVLMPCHSTPWYSIIHQERPMWFLTCEPPLTADPSYQDEADRFYMDPSQFLEQEQPERIYQSKHLVLFDSLVPRISGYLESHGFKECQRFFNSHFHDDARRRGDVVVYCH